MKKCLLIGNGPSAIARDIGADIDAFDGPIIRFNDYRIEGYEEKVGTREDIWITTAAYGPHLKKEFDEVIVMTWATDRECKSHMSVRKFFPEVPKFDASIVDQTRELVGYSAVSTGAVAVTYFSKDYEVWIYGFDFFNQRIHHYSDDLDMGPNHNKDKEWAFFNQQIFDGEIKQFGFNPQRETMPLTRWPVPCGTDDNVSWYREPAHNAWYKWFGEMSRGMTVLDVGAGTCEGMKVLLKEGCADVVGFDVDPRLDSYRLLIEDDLGVYPDNCVDVVTCVDVIEHCVEDLSVMNEMKRIARKRIFVTTPNYTRSKCGNICHAREYTIAQFMNFFRPSEIYSASPDGTVHRTKLLRMEGDIIVDYSNEGPMNKEKGDLMIYKNRVPINKRFNITVDGQEWGHICAIFNL